MIILSSLLVFQSCGKDDSTDSDVQCSIGQTCNGVLYIGDIDDAKVLGTLGECALVSPTSCINLFASKSEASEFCSNLSFANFNDWKLASETEYQLMEMNKIYPNNFSTAWYANSYSATYVAKESPYGSSTFYSNPVVGILSLPGKRALCVRYEKILE